MAMKKVVLVTGAAGAWGSMATARLLGRLEQDLPDNGEDLDASYHVIGLDTTPPIPEIKGLDFIQADVRNPLFMDLLKLEDVYAVLHLAFMESIRPVEAAFDLNVIGTMKVLGACAESGVRKVVLMSSTAVYGARPDNSAFLAEQHPLQGSRAFGTTRDLVETEAFCNGFRRQVPEMILTTLRFPSIVGPTVETPMTRFLRQPWAPVLLGFDPMMQVIHEKDVIESLVFALYHDVPGVFNVAAEGVMPLTKLVSLAGKLPLPVCHPIAYFNAGVLATSRVGSGRYANLFTPIEPDYLRYPWVGDLAKMRDELGFTPRYTAEEALREFAGQQRLSRYRSESDTLAYDEERLRDTLQRRRRARDHRAASQGSIEGETYE